MELLNRGVEVDELDLVLSRIGPVDLDLMQQCVAEVWDYNHASHPQPAHLHTSMAA